MFIARVRERFIEQLHENTRRRSRQASNLPRGTLVVFLGLPLRLVRIEIATHATGHDRKTYFFMKGGQYFKKGRFCSSFSHIWIVARMRLESAHSRAVGDCRVFLRVVQRKSQPFFFSVSTARGSEPSLEKEMNMVVHMASGVGLFGY